MTGKYLIVRGKTDIQKFYMKYAIKMQLKYGTEFEGFYINYPIAYSQCGKTFLIMYAYIENTHFVQRGYPVRFMRCFYGKKVKQENSDELVCMIERNYLNSWPKCVRTEIEDSFYFFLWDKELRKRKNIRLGFEHGDYTPNNILLNEKSRMYLMDFEFAVELQPIGYDLYNWYVAKGKKIFWVPYKKMNKIKKSLNDYVNNILDKEYGQYEK